MSNKESKKENKRNKETVKEKKIKKDRKVEKTEEEKAAQRVERAKRLAARKISLKNTYDSLEASVSRVVSWFSATVDRFLFSHKYDKIIAVLLAVILYVTLNFSQTGIVLDSTYTIKNHPVTLNADLSVYEITGYDKNVDVVLTGRTGDVNTARTQSNTKVVLDLTGYQTGEHTIKYNTVNFSNRVSVSTKPESATITIRKKETARFKVTHEYLNLNKMNEKYYPETPIFESDEVLVRASTKTLNDIAYIKALIDVEGVTETFNTEAVLYAYNRDGQRMDVDIIPSILKVEVPISSPSKTVRLNVNPVGIIPNDKSITSITLDHNAIELYGDRASLDAVDVINIDIDASKIDRDMKLFEQIVLPQGIRQANFTQVSLDIKLTDTVSKKLIDIPVAFENNTAGYRTRLFDPEQTTVNIEIFGAQNIIDEINEENFGKVYFDMLNVKPGDVTLPLQVRTSHTWIKYVLEFLEIKMEVVAE